MKKIIFILVIFFCFFTEFVYATPSSHHIKFELIDNRIFVDVYINNQGPFKFIFDTGGNYSMTFDLAKKLSLPVQDAGNGTGAGSGSQPMGITKVQSFQIAGINSTDQDFLVMDYSKIQKSFNLKSLDGILGFEILQSYLTYIDYENSDLFFFSDPRELNKNEFIVLNFTLKFNKPFLKTSVNGMMANTLVDTGDRSALTVTKRLQKFKSIKNSFFNKPEVISGYGIGGPILAKVSTLDSLKFASVEEIKEISARVPTAESGFNSIKGLDASIGNEVLKQFNLGFDYKNKILYIRKNKNFGEKTKFTPVPNPQ